MSRVMDVAAPFPAPSTSSAIASLNSVHSWSSSASHPRPPTLASSEPSPHSTGSSSTSSPSPGRPTPSAHDVWDVTENIGHSAKGFNEGHAVLSLAILSKLFPLTLARCSRSSLGDEVLYDWQIYSVVEIELCNFVFLLRIGYLGYGSHCSPDCMHHDPFLEKCLTFPDCVSRAPYGCEYTARK
ncbi:hypothetical protein BS47DRAFT_1350730 [Hydnum rufescens UP504]|uniref:Uncharacterized protein n=1 Tax=Hydnum rufescens UP504 TaxID=1448309 RepID=A0A9P6DR77_9AGAM|nr:hypothetical protein BS47DRAFT_1350730 [Hydnum rufescens UP504]